MPTRTVSELQEALHHIGYELWMTAEASMRIRSAQRDDDVIGINAYLESMLLHARALSDFFVDTKRGFPSDVRRTDFGDTDWQPGPAEPVARIKANSPVIDKRLAHLTWERVNGDPHGWRFTDAAADLVAVADEWSAYLLIVNPDLYSVFRQYVVRAHQTLTTWP
jgi:hypothetical protein